MKRFIKKQETQVHQGVLKEQYNQPLKKKKERKSSNISKKEKQGTD